MDIFLIAILLTFSAFFSATETAFSTCNRIRIKNLASQGKVSAKKAIKILDHFDNALTAILVGNNIVNILSTSIATVFFTELLGEGSVGIASAVMTVLVLVFGEIMPKSIAKDHAEKFALFMATPLSALIFIAKPIILIFQGLKKAVSMIIGGSSEEPSVTEEELMSIIEEIEDEGVLEEQESNLVRSALEFDETTISEILVPRVNAVAIEENTAIDDIRDIFLQNAFSRLPVYKETIDNIIGIIHQKDFFNMYFYEDIKDIHAIMQKPIYISSHKLISEILHQMQKEKIHMAIVIDQYGGTEGIVTLEDILEELVGEIYDESDDETTPFKKLDDISYELNGEQSLWDFLDYLDLPEDIIDTECNSVGGYLMDLLGHIPQSGEETEDENFIFTATEVDDQKIEKVVIKIKNNKAEEENDED